MKYRDIKLEKEPIFYEQIWKMINSKDNLKLLVLESLEKGDFSNLEKLLLDYRQKYFGAKKSVTFNFD